MQKDYATCMEAPKHNLTPHKQIKYKVFHMCVEQ